MCGVCTKFGKEWNVEIKKGHYLQLMDEEGGGVFMKPKSPFPHHIVIWLIWVILVSSLIHKDQTPICKQAVLFIVRTAWRRENT